ncbi:Citron Rho-interacting kinase [Mizuhopecten yessoensis]|uniref:non-specific serine/threonine protein kinase n=1 Tax=Mizuhopecten yessoensis TaxID=6573 RepID=A0A210Q6D6_MIZYE|nr:Citron Rho-interacting kinase [Mizuhopecten yessoensis]
MALDLKKVLKVIILKDVNASKVNGQCITLLFEIVIFFTCTVDLPQFSYFGHGKSSDVEMEMSLDSICHRIRVLDDLVQGNVETSEIHTSLVTKEGLLDALITLYDECGHEFVKQNKHVAAFVKKYGKTICEIKKIRIRATDFEVKDAIGRGHFGEVLVVREKSTDIVYAMKILRKNETLAQQEISFYEEERDIMAKATSPWITRLHYAFQDSLNLHLVMDFHAGGDLLTLLSRHDDIFEESMARFYLAEMTLSIDALHNMGYVHRDVKPENILLDCQGHVKLADFGSAAKLSSDGLVSSQMPVGTPDYVSPELLITMNNDQRKSNSGVEVDWWSLGICLYEMLFGKTPFTDEGGSMVVTYSNIMNFKKCLKFPENHHVSSSGVSLIRSLLAEKDDRLSFRDITKHKFFCSINWDDIRQETPPFVPHLSCLDDTSNFEELERVRYQPTFEDFQKPQEFTGKDLPFVGFTYIRKQNQDGQPKNIKCCSGSDSSSETDFSSTETEYLAPARAPHSPGHTDLQVTLTVKVAELQTLKEDCHKLEETECRLKAEVERLKFKGQEKDDELCRLNIENEGLQVDLQRYVERSEDWKEQLEVALHERDQLELKAENLLVDVKDMQTEADQIETEIHRSEMEEIQDMVVELEQDKCNLRTKLKSREKQLALCREQIESQQDQISKLQRKLDKEQRKSLDGMKRDVSSMEKRNEAWRHKIEGKNMEVMTLNIKLQEMEELLEVYQLQEKDFMEREQELLRRVDGGGLIDKMELRVWLKSCPMQESKDSENRKRRIEELEQHVTMLDNQAEEWREKEDGFQETIDQLQREMDTLLQELKTSEKSKHSLAHQVRFYQEEAKQLKQRLQDLSENVKQVSQDEDEKTKHTSLVEKRVKDLEADVELLRTERRHLLADVIKFQEEADNKTFKVAELERVHTHVTQTISRMTSRLERLERQLTDSRDREVEVRLRAKEHADFRLKVANEKIKGLEEEKASLGKKQDDIKSEMDSLKLQVCRLEGGKSEASSLKDECDRKSSELIETKNQLSKSKEEKFDLSQKVRRLTDDKDNLERSVSKLEERVEKLNKRLKEAESQAREVIVLRSEKEGLERRNEHLQKETSKLNELTTVQKERDALTVKLQSVEKELEEQKLLATKRWNKIADAEDIRQTNNYLESKVKDQQEKVEQLEIKVKSLEGDLKASKERENRIQSLMEEVDRLRLEKKSLEVKMRELQVEWESKQRETTGNKREVHVMEEKFSKEKEKHDQVIVELRRELHDANLALSEARSLLAASERQERNNKERYESEIRDLQLKLHRSENIIDLEQELKLLKSQAEKSTRQYKEMEDRISSLQKEKSSINMEKHMIQDQLVQKEHECELETQKVSKLQTVCSELEEQLQELEALTEEHDRQQSEWNNIRETFETAVVEREEEIEGTSHRLHALEQAKQTASEKVANIKKQMTSTKASHKAEIEALNHRIWEIQRAGLKNEAKVSELKEHNMQLKCVADSQKRNLEADLDEKRALKEEISTVMTECQDLRTKNLKLKHHLDEAMDKFELIFGEKMDLEGFTDALQGVHFLEKYKFESTIGQQMKLIDYLHALWAENSATKKKKSGSKLFGSAKTKDVLSPGNPMPYLDLQTALDQERKRCNKLQEQNEKLRQEKFAQANEWCEENTIPGASEKNQSVLKLMGSLKENDTLTPSDRVAVAALVRSPSAHSASVNLLTPSVKRSSSVYSYSLPQTASQRMHHNIPHRFITGLNTRATKCAVCLGSVPFVKQASKCQECHMSATWYVSQSVSQQLHYNYRVYCYRVSHGMSPKVGLSSSIIITVYAVTECRMSVTWYVTQSGSQQLHYNYRVYCYRVPHGISPKVCLSSYIIITVYTVTEYHMSAAWYVTHSVSQQLHYDYRVYCYRVSHGMSPKVCLSSSIIITVYAVTECRMSATWYVSQSVSQQLHYTYRVYCYRMPHGMSPKVCLSSSSIITVYTVTEYHMVCHPKVPHGISPKVCLSSSSIITVYTVTEYHMVCHPKCVSAAPATCGLPTEYVQHFQEIMSLDENTPVNRKLSLCKDDKPIHMQGFLKIPSTGTQGWERKWASLEDNILMLYNNETDANPIDSFNLNPQETDVTVHSAISTAELPNTAQTDLNHVIKVEHEPLTTCWPGRVLYLMAMNFSEKSKWVASFEGAVKNLQKKDSVKRQKLQTTVIMELMGEKRLDINCTKVFSKQMLLLGADEGLYAVSMQIGKPTTKVKLAGFKSVHQIEIISAVGMVIMVIGKNRRVVWVDKKLIKIKLDQATGNESPPVHYDEVEGMFCCTLLEVKRYHDTVYMCVGMVDRVIILKYNTDLRAFCVRKELMTSAPCSCMCITNDFVIVGTDKFYRIDLEHPAMTEFVDKKDNSLAFAAFGAAIHKSFPIDVVKVSPEGLPLEYLLCFHEFGVFVDIKGRRSRPKDLKWSCLPLAFGYSEPFLYIIYFNSVQGITIPADKDDTRGKQTILDMHCPRYLGRAIRIGGVYVSISDGQGTQLVCLRGNDGMNINYYEDNKENKYSLAVNKGKGRFGSPRRGNTMGSSHMRRQLSGSSLDSNFSEVSSVSTATSVESCTTYGSEI